MIGWTITKQPTWQRRNQPNNQPPVPTAPDPKLVKEGFPEQVSKAFQKAADELNCVIWSRVPGKACTTLIDEGYNLKPFYVHGKSCNWGPMAGFVCQLPALNKAGTSKMAYNLKEHINSLVWLVSTQATERERDKVADSLFLPLVISDKRKQELLNSGFLPNHKKIGNDLIFGIAQDKDETIAFEYVIKKDATSNLWHIYHRNIYIKDRDRYVSYLKKNGDKFSIDQEDANKRNAEILASYNEIIEESIEPVDRSEIVINDIVQINQGIRELNIIPVEKVANPLENFYPVNGVQSPYLAYRDEKDLYKNAVSGDYDLFAVWPFTPNISFEMTTRISELPAPQPAQPNNVKNLFIPVEKKENALEITSSRNVFIEFIGTYQELDGKEDSELGNINDLVQFTAQTLNSLVRAQYLGKHAPDKGQFPNRAFHSDEGGRPGVDEIEYPIAFFMPSSKPLWNDLKQEESRLIKNGLVEEEGILKSTAFVVENHVEFLSLVKLLKRRFYVFLHDGWFMHWMCLAAGKAAITEQTENIALPDKARQYLEARIREMDRLDNGALRNIESLLQELLISTSLPASAALTKAFQDVTDNFLALATYPQSPDAAERKDLISSLEIEIPE
ncbi:anthrax toxin-like adenylyl cyclase domain-containing protein [Acaryochloris sp. IP29b_bin.137]|uniref:anthrax toxin-like adenylyl cyclase domain-containing protein n=1 Tax=Acaryochloris sp. IP29b_bin.137 TaxID=2969217 RepID=UPI00261875C2|nr:anthrax toxin-like adenylyl cyclase domain-containing protein [Acaryochloris sp. IP29b_bin.137]